MNRLAIDGGTPVRTVPFPRWPDPGAAEIEAVTHVLQSSRINYWTGTEGRDFESEYAHALGRRHALAVPNGTLALELALRAFGVGAGDEVIVPSRTFIATAAAVVTVGATPVVADIDTDSGALTAETIGPLLSKDTRAIIPVHVGGWPVDMAPLLDIAATHDVLVIEDCAQAHGGSYRDRPVGALGSHAAAFSFCQDKILPTGEGGMLVLDDTEAYKRAWAYRDHGKSYDAVHEPPPASHVGYRWLVEDFGTNWRMDELSAAVGRVGLGKLPVWHARRTCNALRLAAALEGVPGIRVPLPGDGFGHAFYRLYAFVELAQLAVGWTRDRVMAAILAEGVPCQYGTCAEIYREAAFAAHGLGPAHRLPGAERAHEASIAFFVHPTLTDREMDDTAAAVRKVLGVAAR